jgi:hypothetical protein
VRSDPISNGIVLKKLDREKRGIYQGIANVYVTKPLFVCGTKIRADYTALGQRPVDL